MFREDEHVDRLVDDALHGVLTPHESDRVERHASACPRCAAAFEQARQRLRLMQSLPPVEPPATLVPAVVEAIASESFRRRSIGRRFALGGLAALAAGVLALISLQVYYANLRPNPMDLVVLGQRDLMTASPASLRVRLTNRSLDLALPGVSGVPVSVGIVMPDGTRRELAKAMTDDEGSAAPRFDVPDVEAGTYQIFVSAGSGSAQETVVRPVQLRRSWKVMLTSDRPVYQPGQKILVRSLALRRPDLRPVGGQQAVYTLTDPRGNVLFKHSPVTSKFGISSAECELDREILEGTYTIACKIGDTESKLAVEVKRYVLPKFAVQLALDRPYYAPGTTAEVRVKAGYFFGKAVSEAEVEVFLRGSLPGESAPVPVVGRTDAKGEVRVKVPLPRVFAARPEGGMRVGGDATLKLEARVRDRAGQLVSRWVDCLVTNTPFRIEVAPESGTVVRQLTNRIYLQVKKADGTPVAGGKLEIHRSTAQGDAGEVLAKVEADSVGTAVWTVDGDTLNELITLNQATQQTGVQFWVSVVDAGGSRLVRQSVSLPLGSGSGDFLVRLDRPVYRAGQSMGVQVYGVGTEPVFVDVIRDGQTLLSERVEMKEGKGEQVVDLPADVVGTLQLVAYRFGRDGLPVRKARVVQVLPTKGVKITAGLDAKTYRPGARATLNLRLTDDAGKPAPGVVSLAAVDEAVFSVLAQRPGMEQVFYTLEQELLKPVYAIYPQWMPTATPESLDRENALFARTAIGLDGARTVSATQRLNVPPASEAGPHTLAVRTLPGKVQQVQQRQRVGMEVVQVGWVALVLTGLLAGYAALWAFVPVGLVLKIHGVGMVGLLVLGGAFVALLVTHPQMRNSMDFSLAKSAMPGGAVRESARYFEEGGSGNDVTNPRVRNYFPETLLWKPELVTDDEGRIAPLVIPLADSITQWRLSASAVTGDGRMGATQLPITVFQPFFVDLDLPVALTRGDEVGVPVVVHNHTDRKQTVKLTLVRPAQEWFALTGPTEQTVELEPREVRSVRYPVRVTKVGTHRLRVMAVGETVSDALEREVEVIPDGQRVEKATSGSLDRPASVVLDVPAGVIDGSVKAFVKFYPSGFSQLVEGLDNIFRMPNGCFEQTSSATYPNVLALEYLKANRLSVPAVEAKARQYIHLGYQRLVGFEVNGGGFDWYGNPPAKLNLTAYGLMEFTDMARVHDVDSNLIDRTRNWLLRQRRGDGSWKSEQLGSHLTGQDDLATTAYVAWAVYGDGKTADASGLTRGYLTRVRPVDVKDAHTLALVANALLAIEPQGESAGPYVDRLVGMAEKGDGGRLFWKKSEESRTMFYGAGISADVETTALAALALIADRRNAEGVRGALSWLVTKKDPQGTWYSTQATILALKALIAGSKGTDEKRPDRLAKVSIGGHAEDISTQADVLKMVDITRHVKPGTTRLELREVTRSGMGYQVVLRYHVATEKKAQEKEPLGISLAYDRTELAVNETIGVKARVVNRQTEDAPMVMVELPVPPGFVAGGEAFDGLVKAGKIGRYQIRARSVLVYLRGLEAGKTLELEYTLAALMVVKATTPGARVYEYYDPQKSGSSGSVEVKVKAP